MVATISINDFKKKLKQIFSIENKANGKYAEIWLSDVDFGGLYHSDKYVVNVKVDYQIESCNEEIKHIVTNMFQALSEEELSFIWRVEVFNADEQLNSQSGDILVYSKTDIC